MIYNLMTDMWRFLKKYHDVPLTDTICQEIRREQEAIVERYQASENVHELASELMAAALGYFYRDTRRGVRKWSKQEIF